MSTPGTLLSPVQLGPYRLRNRAVMSPLTRSRAGEGDVPSPLAVEYYRQRATAGLIITEGSQVSAQGKGYPRTPGIFSDAQVAGWKHVTDAVHAEGGRIFLQLWHVGRLSHPDDSAGRRDFRSRPRRSRPRAKSTPRPGRGPTRRPMR